MEVRGEAAEITQEGAIARADVQTGVYTSDAKRYFCRDIYPEEQRFKETPVIVKIGPHEITTNAIFACVDRLQLNTPNMN